MFAFWGNDQFKHIQNTTLKILLWKNELRMYLFLNLKALSSCLCQKFVSVNVQKLADHI